MAQRLNRKSVRIVYDQYLNNQNINIWNILATNDDFINEQVIKFTTDFSREANYLQILCVISLIKEFYYQKNYNKHVFFKPKSKFKYNSMLYDKFILDVHCKIMCRYWGKLRKKLFFITKPNSFNSFLDWVKNKNKIIWKVLLRLDYSLDYFTLNEIFYNTFFSLLDYEFDHEVYSNV